MISYVEKIYGDDEDEDEEKETVTCITLDWN